MSLGAPKAPFVWGGYTYPEGYGAYIRSIHLTHKIGGLRDILKDFEEELAAIRHEATAPEVDAALVRMKKKP